MTARQVGFWFGLAAFLVTLALPAPAGMPPLAWPTAGLVVWMAAWWMTEALPLTATALLPFVVLPLLGVSDANVTAATYYSPILFLILGGAFIALAVERTGLHRRLALAILARVGESGGSTRLLFAFMIATALLSAIISNTSTALIMMPMALAVLAGGGVEDGETEGIAGALPMGIAFAASIGGLGTIVGSPTNAIAVGLLDKTLGLRITFVEWSAYGMPMVILGVALAAWIIARVQRLGLQPFDLAAARESIAHQGPWSTPERRLVPLVGLTVLAWVTLPLFEPMFPRGGLTDGTIAVVAGLLLFVTPDGTGRPMLTWREADRAPWGVIMMFGGGLALAAGMTASGLAGWLGEALLPLRSVPLLVVALALTGFVVVVTEFASNVATASGVMPVVASLILALGADPVLLAVPAAFAASWGFMLPSGTGPNAIAWATGHIALPRMLKAGLWLDLGGVLLIVAIVWSVAAVI
ncbi:MAG: DASS family sodium-coupled anion symporter [Novosphingobium sp.]|nr:DASS family sodium-coupled anion symporter [Novosphingobium sp.]